MRYFSKRYAGGTTMNISGINKYMTFGLKQEWISVLASESKDFRSTTALGNRMIPAAVTWFREAKLIADSIAIQPTRLLDIGQKFSFDYQLFWDLIWIGLTNTSPLMKWYVCNVLIGETKTQDELNERLTKSVTSASVRKGAMQSLCGTFKFSPLGCGTYPVVKLEVKGPRVISLKRVARSVDPLVILYSLYVMAQAASRSSFTLSEMMSGDFESPYISPLIAFGMPVDELKAQCMGLTSKYPGFIACSFALGLDEIKVFPNEKTIDDIVGMILGE
jgi:phosphoadenosine phosphosulfate reductase